MQGASLAAKEHEGVADRTQTDPDLEDLVRQLVAYVDEESIPSDLPPENGSAQEIVLEVRVDGMRYTLTRSPPPSPGTQVKLSPRETEIVRLVAKGLPNKSIAAVLDISPWTVATHLRRVFGKLGVSCRAEMVARVLKEELLTSNN